MNDSVGDEKQPFEIDFSEGVRGLHHIPPGAKIFLLASMERDIDINEALKRQCSYRSESRSTMRLSVLPAVRRNDIERRYEERYSERKASTGSTLVALRAGK